MQEVNWVRFMGALAVACAVVVHPLQLEAAALVSPNTTQQGVAAAEAPPAAQQQVVAAAGQTVAPEPEGAKVAPKKMPQHHDTGIFGSTQWGGRGIHRLVSGFPSQRYALVLGGYSGYAKTSSVFLAGDRNSRSNHSIDLAVTPVTGVELSASYRLLVNSYSGLAKRNLQAQGSPTFRIKYGRHAFGPIALGLQLAGTMPTSATGRGLAAKATSVEALGLISYHVHPRIEVVGNIGYLMDRSNSIYGGDSADLLQRYAYQINRVSAVPYGVGAQGRITLGQAIELQPFLELTGALGTGSGATLKNAPFRGTVGAKIYPFYAPVIELAVGSDIALGGRPQPGSPFGGQPSWEVFAHLHAHLGEILALARTPSGAASARGSSDPYAKVFGDPSHDMATFRLQGHVLDADSNRPVFGAQVMVGEVEDVLLATHEHTGIYRSWPIAAGPGLLRITATASGYVKDERLIPRPKADEVVSIDFDLKADLSQQRLATLKGSFKDVRTGKAIARGTVRIDALGVEGVADRAGAYALRGKPGRYRITFMAPKYVTVERTLTLRPNETLVFNAELRPDVQAQ